MAGGGNNIARMSPRQRMINIMYIVLIAMLALNVSSDVLTGFKRVNEGLEHTRHSSLTRNEHQFQHLEDLYSQNPVKAAKWYTAGKRLHERSNRLLNHIEMLKRQIAVAADGDDGNYLEIKNTDDLNAAAEVMLNPLNTRGKSLCRELDSYRDYVIGMLPAQKRAGVAELLSTSLSRRSDRGVGKSWEEEMFEEMPAIAAVTLLTKIQNDITQAESEVLSGLISSIDIGDVRVNELNAYVLSQSNMVMKGGKYAADIVLAAIDTTKRPTIYVNGQRLRDGSGHYEVGASSTGVHQLAGYIEVPRADGNVERRNFKSSYTVIEPMATISPTMMNILYAGIDNPISISVPGVPMSAISATMTNGNLVRVGDRWIARAGKVGAEAVISVSAMLEGRLKKVGQMSFKVRKLPDPTVYLPVRDGSGNLVNYKGTPRRISKGALMNADILGAAIDDDILNVNFNVVSFTTLFFDQLGNAIPELSNGAHFSARQIEQFKRLKAGKSFFVTNVKAKGPDGIVRDISPMEVAIN